ncbi:type II secretion system F family protein [Pseudoalteromonas ruthenica]|uniref:Type II secretion system protein F n=1 Tax=Pseudoalteromonas ruthenica TaxID=151081 RepID=A0A0F4PQW9_9GAMM|nr:type II secretion system F family protein [Pseudoalteromonas ruthenica]KJY97822.1 type II secretion system protein F [Pseudoalteromonas ruthenica]KJZ01849.1 type II secretion system protein F [Pseudoalteromonas ruthenica]TMO89215.1 type II secretion system F family protein [Pseudoalteromonas ruthenica]TMO94751.1 type II secretion system F family protein [Pseudoalteromonas ruthenica]TMO99864.1 type II secretion system F family protein [Pseudoalteromonas ruthenica]|tara:strand:- start:6797 stop:8026 length:1230 start_codon:yes stop_codon:yes gene_type:complete
MAKQQQANQLDTFQWVGVSTRGKKLEGELTGTSIALVKAQLRKQGITPSKVKRKPKPLFGLSGEKKISAKDIAMFTRQLATMLLAGVSLVQAIDMIADGSENKSVKNLLRSIGEEVKAGQPLSTALRKHPKYFDDLYCDLVASGEQSGALDRIFDRVALYKEKAEALKSKIKKAMFYPVAVIFVAAIVTSILLIFVVPQFKEIFEGFGAELPAFTLLVISISEFMQAYWWIAVLVLGIGGYVFKQAHRRNKQLRDNVDKLILKTPIVGSILNKAAVARYARTLSTTFAAGVPLVDALDSAAGASGNAVYRDAILDIKAEVSSGNPMNWAMRNSNIFPDMVIQMVAIGEESGSLDDMLAKVATIYEQEVDDAVDGLSSLLEPLIMAVLGVLIGGLIIAMYLPIFQLGSVI